MVSLNDAYDNSKDFKLRIRAVYRACLLLKSYY